MTYQWDPADSMLDPSTAWIASRSALADDVVLWKQLAWTFTISLAFAGLVGNVVLQWREQRKRGRR